MTPTVELIYFEGCPHVERARHALRSALGQAGLPPEWKEWDQESGEAPARVQGYGSPTVLIGGLDVRGWGPGADARSCRVEGSPSTEEIRRGLAESGEA